MFIWFQEWTEFLDRAFTINIPQVFASIEKEVEEKTDTGNTFKSYNTRLWSYF